MSHLDSSGPPEAAALLAEREHLRALLRLMPVGVYIVDALGRPLESNPVAESIWGGPLPRVGLEGYGVYEGYWPGSGRRLEPHEWALARTLRDGQPVVNEELELVAFDGARRTVLHSTTALKDAQGTIVGAVAVKVDITTRRQAEHAEAFLTEATRLLVESLDWESTLQAVARLATRQLADFCIIDVVGEDGELHRLVASAREPAHQPLMNELLRFPPKVGSPSPLSRVFLEGRTLLLPDISREALATMARTPEHLRAMEELGPRACMAVPLSVGARRVGVLNFILSTPGRRYTERELKYAEELARRVAFVVEHARLFREAQGALRARDTTLALLEAFLAASPVGMGFVDRELRYALVNPVLAAMNGKSPEAHRGHTVRELLPEPEEATFVERLLREVMERGEPRTNRNALIPARPGIPPRPVHSTFFPVKVGGETLGVGLTVLDITEQKQVEEGLRFLAEATTRLSSSLEPRTTMESTVRVVAEHLADCCMLDVRSEDGKRLERVAAAARRAETQRVLEEARRLSPHPHPDSPTWRVLESGRALLVSEVGDTLLEDDTLDAHFRATLAPLRPRSVMFVPLIARERTLGVLTVVSQDETRRYTERDLAFVEDLAWRAALAVDNARLFHQAEQAVAARDDFVAIATHELRNPLSALSLQLTALQRTVDAGHMPTEDKLRQSLVTARRQTERLERLVSHLLDVSRVSTGHLELEREEVDLAQLVHWVVVRFEEKLAEAGCTAVVRAEAPVVAKVDRLRVEQVVMNLLSNAMKYAAGQPVELHVEHREGTAVLGVRDFGPGITPEMQARIFERYQRATGKHARESLGLGLYVSRQIARAHGGELKVESTPGQGAHFLLHLPLG
ncbi:MAG TPA: GAF domain-containing protein [Archangium sp.]|uniref:sensor histidine kinase n=1 Tax=Archangium sp. TaxID=1872627 RepID=UPI002E37E568|nr:GAF domain-containing protein [Archangium sp.]HEX5749852.1 GAF domain-containing protein [Archangium sp.]